MRLHRLEICAIGPFAEPQIVDFDRLNEAGIFLLAGPTGSGKTSVLDAVSIALFGQAPGARQRGKDLVSHHRDPDQLPQVRLEATLGSRRIRVTRTPAHTRPKKRGEGETEENPSVALEVAGPDGEWQPLSSRIAEADRQIREWLGMDSSQFSQVVMLPQGEFATFLRADARDRRRLLERLFPTHDFAFVERWLRDRAAEAREVRDDKRSEIERRLAAAVAVAGEVEAQQERVLAEAVVGHSSLELQLEDGVPPGPDGDGARPSEAIPSLEEPETVLAWVARRNEEFARAAREAVEAQAETKRRLDQAQTRLSAAEDRASQIARRGREKEQAVAEWKGLRTELSREPDLEPLPDDPLKGGIEVARSRERALRAQVAELQGFEKAGLARRGELASGLKAISAETESIEAEKKRLIAAQVEAPTRMEHLEGQLREAENAAARLPGVEQALTSIAERLAAAVRRDGLAPQLEAAEQAVKDERDLALAAREHWLHLREARLAGIAAELAAGLEPDAPCPVCGADEHPHPAAATLEAPSKQDEEEAEADLGSRERAVEEARARCEALQQEHQHFDGRAGGANAEALIRERAQVERECAQLREKAEQRESLAEELGRQRDAQAAASQRLKELDGNLARLAERRAACESENAEIDQREDALRGDDASVPIRRHRLAAIAELLHKAGDAAFRAAEADRAAAAAASIELEVPLEEALQVHGEAAVEHEQATSLAATSESRQSDFEREAAHLPNLIEQYEPLVEAAAVAGELAGLAQGNNPARLQLSTYVLAARLEQVIEAANLRLAPMSSGRYRLVYSAELAGRGAVSGLGIRVLDAHTGLEREASSLSGGESFYASLSLALGLAEVVQRESGGRRLETLFIDEGFGSLDSDTLDQVMAVLDELRDGGRVIGLVSHVEELKTRIPSRIEVTPTPAGSTIDLVGV